MRAGQQLESIAYARCHLAPWAGQYLPELQRAAALLAFQADTLCAPYKQLFDDARVGGWADAGRRGGEVGMVGGWAESAVLSCCWQPACSLQLLLLVLKLGLELVKLFHAELPPSSLQWRSSSLAHHLHWLCRPLLSCCVPQWLELVELFHQELYRLNFLPPTSLLSIHLQARWCLLM